MVTTGGSEALIFIFNVVLNQDEIIPELFMPTIWFCNFLWN